MTDFSRALTISIEKVAEPGEIIYTERQLYYELCRTLRSVPGLTVEQVPTALLIGLLPAFFLLYRFYWAAAWIFATAVMVQSLRLLQLIPFTSTPPISYDRFVEALRFYRAKNGSIPGLLSTNLAQPVLLERPEPDLFDYGLSHLLICQDDEIVRMLLANHVHLELSCPVLTLSEATPLPAALCKMLSRTPDSKVYFLHDASPEGLALVPALRQRLVLPKSVRLTALGLRPSQALRLHLFTERNPPQTDRLDEWPAYLSAREQQWLLTGRQVELQALPPAQLLRALQRNLLGTPPKPFAIPNMRQERSVGFMTWPDHNQLV